MSNQKVAGKVIFKKEGAPYKRKDKGIQIRCSGCGSISFFKMIRNDGRYPCKYCGCSRVFRNPGVVKKMFDDLKKSQK